MGSHSERPAWPRPTVKGPHHPGPPAWPYLLREPVEVDRGPQAPSSRSLGHFSVPLLAITGQIAVCRVLTFAFWTVIWAFTAWRYRSPYCKNTKLHYLSNLRLCLLCTLYKLVRSYLLAGCGKMSQHRSSLGLETFFSQFS